MLILNNNEVNYIIFNLLKIYNYDYNKIIIKNYIKNITNQSPN